MDLIEIFDKNAIKLGSIITKKYPLKPWGRLYETLCPNCKHIYIEDEENGRAICLGWCLLALGFAIVCIALIELIKIIF